MSGAALQRWLAFLLGSGEGVLRHALHVGRTGVGVVATSSGLHLARVRFGTRGERLIEETAIPAGERSLAELCRAAGERIAAWRPDDLVIGYAGPGLLERSEDWPEVARVDVARFWARHRESVLPPLVAAEDVVDALAVVSEGTPLRVRILVMQRETLAALRGIGGDTHPAWIVPLPLPRPWATGRDEEAGAAELFETARRLAARPVDHVPGEVVLETPSRRAALVRELRRQRFLRVGALAAGAILFIHLASGLAEIVTTRFEAAVIGEQASLAPLADRRDSLATALADLHRGLAAIEPPATPPPSPIGALVALARLLPETVLLEEIRLSEAGGASGELWMDLSGTADGPAEIAPLLNGLPEGVLRGGQLLDLRSPESESGGRAARTRFRLRIHVTP